MASSLYERPRSRSLIPLALALGLVAGCQPGTSEQPAGSSAAMKVPYEGAFGPSAPPDTPLPPEQTPVEPAVQAALNVLYQRPSPKGPAPIPLASPSAIYVEGRSPVVQALPGPAAFPDRIPHHVKAVLPEKIPFSNNVERLPEGEIRFAAVDRTSNDTKKSDDWMVLEASFTDTEGAQWRIEQVTLAPISSNPVSEPWYGGVAMDILYHGDTGNGTPAVPLVNCAMCSWGWADIYKDGKRVASSAPLHVMLTSDTRDDREGFRYHDYDSTDRPVREVHLVVAPSAYLPTPGGFLHVMWEDAEITRGSPEQVRAKAGQLAAPIPTIELVAAPYLRWDKKNIPVKAGQKYRLIVHNQDPTSFHQFMLHETPESAGHHGGSGLRHEAGETSGRIGGLWRPEEQHKEGDPPAPRNVFFSLPQGSTWATMVKFEKPGEYEFMCPVGNHYRRGMAGKFVVSAGQAGGEK